MIFILRREAGTGEKRHAGRTACDIRNRRNDKRRLMFKGGIPKFLGVERPTETVIIDGLDPNWVTVMRYTDYAWRDVPEAWLQRDYLPRFKPE